jgi:hypothetical protein
MLYTVDPKLMIVTFGGVPLTGWAEDQFDIEKAEDLFNEMVGCTGETARVHVNNSNATAKLSFLQTSPSNDYLSTMALRDYQTNAGVLPFTVKDVLGTTLIFSPMAYVKKPANVSSGKAVKTRDWNLYLVNVQFFVGGNTPTL